MTAHDVAYIEIHTGDLERTTDYFVSAFGFREQARSRGGGLDSALLRQGGIRLVIGSGPAADAFLAVHGDGVVDIAFACDDVAAARADALAAGGREVTAGDPATPAVSGGFGAVRHTLLPRAAAGGPAALPPGRTWVPSRDCAGPSHGAPALNLLDHIAVCLPAGTLHDAVRYYTDGFGFERYYSEYVAVGEQAMDSIVVRSPSAGITFTMIEPDISKQPGQIDEFLTRNGGGGVQHLAFLVDEIVPAVLEFEARGVTFLQTPGTYYDALADRIPHLDTAIADLRKANVLADQDEWGHLLQLFTRSPFAQRTLFFELIQRHGAQGFGSSNIRALYEAVERTRTVTA
ncbi:4-hydroxyphenylpyruvate dioxygenase [Streptomyces sp. NBC_00536]|uniref:4-hydroxyphenylpyruvate dioxygenase n=1 Tax=Streptomyces sp. NBC_00536 TaxID=2975769 RepID=UPI002E82349D|nr:4-hydroxyphenylpyruvate dioxygenase [Streptomyces sp. NBC_00536]WUC79108.1 4-hydroxyphenylpyruvate dioxygenase [Streptomyces sp. NBC_00536]